MKLINYRACFPLFTLMTFVLFANACNYGLVGRGSSLPPGVASASIPVFENRTGEPDVDTIVTRVVKDEFINDGRLKIVDSPSADSVIKGVIESYHLRPLAYDADNNVTEYSVDLDIMITHASKRSGKVILHQLVQTTWRYKADPSISVAESLRYAAIESAAKKAAESIVSLIIESF